MSKIQVNQIFRVWKILLPCSVSVVMRRGCRGPSSSCRWRWWRWWWWWWCWWWSWLGGCAGGRGAPAKMTMLTRIAQTFRYTTRCNQRTRNLTSFRAKWINSCPISCPWQIKRLAQTVSFTFNCFWNFSLERWFEAGKGFSWMFLAAKILHWIFENNALFYNASL